MERKSSDLIHDVDENRIVTGYFASFGDIDSDGDIMQKGAFAKTISESWKNGRTRVKYLLDHKKDNVVGVIQELKEDDKGLWYKAKVGMHTKGEDYYKMLLDGIVDQHSIGFYTKASRKEGANRVITEVQLIEGSGIQFRAANPNTPVTSVKSEEELMELATKLENAIKNGSYSDETILELKSKLDTLFTDKKPAVATSESMKNAIVSYLVK
jgi:HK97 family phage prohead protease